MGGFLFDGGEEWELHFSKLGQAFGQRTFKNMRRGKTL
jgi:hypothetical protein